jgi:hypothetical protein
MRRERSETKQNVVDDLNGFLYSAKNTVQGAMPALTRQKLQVVTKNTVGDPLAEDTISHSLLTRPATNLFPSLMQGQF